MTIPEVAADNHGYVMARDARAAGVDPAALRKVAATGRLERTLRVSIECRSSLVVRTRRMRRPLPGPAAAGSSRTSRRSISSGSAK